ncbi:alcohol dehydrogenase-like isoform X1 [Branchiostoma floridae]|uniref:Alcohol dehydrogenase-like isoform X1 n=2 Tax=Branchiostoma floridae TaxID=7739 RepID=A0A9J7L1F6_BRAFL|nr:alcohol dehydrogenase-like isoform X1 [Branchiostoma floridae]
MCVIRPSVICTVSFIVGVISNMARRSMRLVEYGKPFQLTNEEVPTAPKGGAVVKTDYAGVCHSDLHGADGDFGPFIPLQVILGHEIAGTVHDVDPSADFKVGDRVMVYWTGGCGECKRCEVGQPPACLKNVKHWAGITEDGGFSDYVIVPDVRLLVKVPDTVAMDTACLLPCSALTAYNTVCTIVPTVQDFAKYSDDCAVLLVGAGGLGLWGVQFAKVLLPVGVRVICADISEEKLAAAKEVGCDEVLLWGKDVDDDTAVAAAKEVCGDLGAVAAIDFVNAPSTFERLQKMIAEGGIHALVGFFGVDAPAAVPLMPFVVNRHTITGVIIGSLPQLRELTALVAQGKVKPPPISHHPLEDVYDVMQGLKAGKVKGRAVVKF